MNIEAFLEHIYKGQKRKTGENYTSHLYATKKILEEAGVTDETILKAALLHDIIEDTQISKEYLILKFGASVVRILELLSKEDMWHTSYCRAKANLDAMEASWVNYPEAILIKMADRLHNLQTIEGFGLKKQGSYLAESKNLLLPLFKGVLVRNNLGYLRNPIIKLLDRLECEIMEIEKRLYVSM